ncbi:DNA mismatch repair endonuclease MutL [Paenibacillus sp. J5C_2022]|uniref:DNA mismatch repair endonuclease MutL n=1 Tax=Paenibacillus sp. J5C2022 TaxID=2977129 RepID=UPI0021D26E03|nr:DNA mismatch repair endonuclease MutL [Paenibacillus sp. J5C2022]MCU6708215.1 DNA mismatch repair endonuclease MutL [Paenibacillus sp. J5C2022]
MTKIRVLEEQLANQIAAGEVVERPASVVKELVENAVDAGSTTIDVSIDEGGLTLIKVTDNGGGIAREDMETAFLRHATSKIATSSDLFRIASLGFRGEALPSIAAVSRMECISADSDTGLARRLRIEGGSITADEPANAPLGTSMSVSDLFYNTPARLKYMKSIPTELGHISDYMNRIALAHPGIAITLEHNGSVLLRTTGTGDRLQVIAAVYGRNTAKAMLKVEAADSDYTLTGYVSKPELTRANRNGITAIVNGRYIRSHSINGALLQAYHTLLPINRYPLAVLELGMHPSLLDVNVHPSKMEVRFSKEVELRALLEKAVKEALHAQRYTPGLDAGRRERSGPQYVQDTISFHVNDRTPTPSQPAIPAASAARERNSGYGGGFVEREYVPAGATERLYAPPRPERSESFRERGAADGSAGERYVAGGDGSIGDASLPRPELEDAPPPPIESAVPSSHAASATDYDPQAAASAAVSQSSASEAKGFPELHWIGQHHGTYLIAQSEDGLYLIDQHAAHERINYEYYLHKFGNPVAASQQLLVPITLEFTPGDAAQLKELLHLMSAAGVELESFGSQTFLVRACPEWLPKGQEESILEEMADLVIRERKHIDIGKLREEAAIMCSCKASIKANDRLTREEGEGLLRRLADCDQPYTCPHGRPIIVHLSTYQLEKMFKRVMS